MRTRLAAALMTWATFVAAACIAVYAHDYAVDDEVLRDAEGQH